MTQVANNYGIVLYELGVEKDTVDTMMDIFSQTEELPKMLQNPVISKEVKVPRNFPQQRDKRTFHPIAV